MSTDLIPPTFFQTINTINQGLNSAANNNPLNVGNKMYISRYDSLQTAISFNRATNVDQLIEDAEKLYNFFNKKNISISLRDYYMKMPLVHYNFQLETLLKIDDYEFQKYFLMTGRQVGGTTMALVYAAHCVCNLGKNVVFVTNRNAVAKIRMESFLALDNRITKIKGTTAGYGINTVQFVNPNDAHPINEDTIIIVEEAAFISYKDLDALNKRIEHSKKVIYVSCLSRDSNNFMNKRLEQDSSDEWVIKLPSTLRLSPEQISGMKDRLSAEDFALEVTLEPLS